MPHHKSCKKRARTNEESRAVNRAYRSQVRNLIRRIRAAQTQPAAQEDLRKATALLDRLSRKGIIHKNSAANYKSKLHHYVNALPAESSGDRQNL